MPTRLRGALLVAGSAAGFGLMPVFARYAYGHGLTVVTLLAARFAVAAVLFFAVLAVTRRLVALSGRQVLALALLGGGLYTTLSTLYFTAIERIPPALAVLLFYLYPIFVIALVATANRERPRAVAVGAAGVSVVGIALVLGAPAGDVDGIGAVAAVAAGAVYAVYLAVGERVTATVPAPVAAAYVTLFSAVSLVLVGAGTGSLDPRLPAGAWPPVLGLALLSTAAAIWALLAGMRALGATAAATISTAEPVVGIAAAALLFDAALTTLQVVGAVVVVAGAALAVAVTHRPPPAAAPSREGPAAALEQAPRGAEPRRQPP